MRDYSAPEIFGLFKPEERRREETCGGSRCVYEMTCCFRVAAVSKMIEEWEMTVHSLKILSLQLVWCRVGVGILLVVAVVCWNERIAAMAINNENNTRQR